MKFLIAILLLATLNINAQDKLLLLNGRVDRGKVVEDKGEILDFKIYKNGGKEKIIPYDKYRIFSITDIKGSETILYKKDTLIGNFYTENQMRMYIYGQRDAHDNFGSAHHFLGGFMLGFSAAIFDTYEFGNKKEQRLTGADPIQSGFFLRSPSIFPIIVPLVVPLGASLLKSNIRKEDVFDVGYLNSEEYVEGFNKVKKFKKIKNMLFGSISGVATGLIAYYIGK